MKRPILRAALIGFVCAIAFAQDKTSQPGFEAATVRPTEGNIMSCTGGPGTSDPGRVNCTGSLGMLICVAYGVQYYQVWGPGWFDTDLYDIVANVPAGAAKAEYQLMMRNLLAERFHLTLHHDTKEMTTRSLVVAKGGSKMQHSAIEGNPGFVQSTDGWLVRFNFKKQSLDALAGFLSTPVAVGGPVTNATGLAGNYDFVLEFTPDAYADKAGDKAGPSIFTALETQLGLKLETKKAPIDVLVIDHAEKKPTEN